MSLFDNFARVTIAAPCPICGKPDWCLASRDDPADPSRVICTRTESTHRWGVAGYLHIRREDSSRARRTRTREVVVRVATQDRIVRLNQHAQAQRNESSTAVLSELLGLPSAPLERLGLGLLHADELSDHGIPTPTSAWTFSMHDDRARVVGLRLRFASGRKLAIPGSHNGLFLPAGMPSGLGRLYIAEGESDTAALLALGVDAIGRAGCNQGTKLLAAFVRRTRPNEIIVVGDGDEPGRLGARELARQLVVLVKSVRVVLPPDGIKDAREWVRSGLTQGELDRCVAEASACQLVVRSAERGGSHGHA